jgi:hypothetical protein
MSQIGWRLLLIRADAPIDALKELVRSVGAIIISRVEGVLRFFVAEAELDKRLAFSVRLAGRLDPTAMLIRDP